MASAALELLVTLKDEASGGLSSLGGSLLSVGKVAGGVALGGIVAFGAAVVDGLGDARQAAGLLAQTEAVIKSTGGAAGVSAQQIVDYASSLSDAAGASLFGDDQIQESENLLLTFTNIKDKSLEAATAISVDMAQALGGAPKDSAIQLGKALNDPINGITALTRVGVTFTDEQKNQIKAMQEAGDMAGAQGVILAELNKEFGGSAQAAADATGGWSEFTGRLGEAKETLGAAVLPLFAQLGSVLLDNVMPAIEAGAQAFSDLVAYFQGGVAAGDHLNDFLAALPPSLDPIVAAVGVIASGIQALIATIADAGPVSLEFAEAVGYFATQLGVSAPVADMLQQAMVAVVGVLQSLMTTFTDAATPTEGLIEVLSRVSPMFNLIRTVVETALPIVQQIVEQVFSIIGSFIEQNGDDIVATVTQAWALVQSIISTATTLISGIVLALTVVVRDLLAEHGDTIVRLLTDAWNIVKNVIMGALEIIQGLLKAALAIFQGDWQGAWEAIQTMSVSVTRRIWEIIKAAFDLYLSTFGTSLDELKGKWDSAWASLQAAVAPVAGWIDGISNAISGAIGWIGRMADKLSSVKIPDWLQGHSPPPMAKWFTYIADSARDVNTTIGGLPDLLGSATGAIAPLISQADSLAASLQSLIGTAASAATRVNSLASNPGVQAFASGGTFSAGQRPAASFGGTFSAPASITVNIGGGSVSARADAKAGVTAALDVVGQRALNRIKTGS